MIKSAIRTLLSRSTDVGGHSRNKSHTDDTSAAYNSSNSVETTPDQSLPATSIIHESFAGYHMPPYPETVRIDEAAFAYQMRHSEVGTKELMPWTNTFKPGGLIQTLHPYCFDSIAGTEVSWRKMWDHLPDITGSSRVCWNEIPYRRAGDGPGTPYTATLGSLIVVDSEGVKIVAGFDVHDGCPADAWRRLQESIASKAEIVRTASEASGPKRSFGRWRR
jgi:hypothetical protein